MQEIGQTQLCAYLGTGNADYRVGSPGQLLLAAAVSTLDAHSRGVAALAQLRCWSGFECPGSGLQRQGLLITEAELGID